MSISFLEIDGKHVWDYPNPYYKTDHELYSVPEAQFLDYIQREGTTVKDYWNRQEYTCFFRRNKDTNQTNDNISIYYPVVFVITICSCSTFYFCIIQM